ncbi:unnamed protein product [Closterium sp. NIES-53]
MTQQVATEHEHGVMADIDRHLDMITSFDHLVSQPLPLVLHVFVEHFVLSLTCVLYPPQTTTALTSPNEPGTAARVVHGVRRILSNWDNFILQPRQDDLVMLGRTSLGPGMLPSFMVKLFWKRIEEVAEGVGVGGGAEHKGGGEGTARVLLEYSYEEEEKIEEDTSRQSQHGVSGPVGNANEQEGSSSESSSSSSSSDESVEHNGTGAGVHPGGTERTEEHGVALGERVDERVKHIGQQATGDDGAVEEQEGGAAAQEGGAGVQQQEGGAAAQEGGVRGQQQEGVAAAQEGGAGGQEQEGGEAAQERQSTLKQCRDTVNNVTEERKLLEGTRTKLDEMSVKIIKGVAAAFTKASDDAVEKQIKLVEEWLVASVMKGLEKAVKEDLFYSTLPPESMKELKDVVREGYQGAKAGRLEVLTEVMSRGFRGSAGPSARLRHKEGVAGVRNGVERRVHECSVPPSSSVGGNIGSPVASPPSRARQTVGKSVEDKEVIVLDQSPLQKTFEAAPKPPPAGKGAMENRGAPTPSGGAAGKGAREKRGAPSQVIVANGLLSKTKADSAAQLSIVDRPVEPVGKRPSSVLGEVCLSEPGSPPPGLRPTSPSVSKKRQAMTNSTKRTVEATKSSDMVELGSLLGQAHVEKASTVVAARHEKSKKSKVIGFAPPPPPDNQCKTRGCKAPFKGSGKMSRKGKPVSEQTVGLKKRFLGTFETEADQKFCCTCTSPT